MPILELNVASDEALSVRRFTARERVSRLYEVDVFAMTENPSVDLEQVIGKPASFRAQSEHRFAVLGGTRMWDGICSFVELVKGSRPLAGQRPLNEYRIRITPALWLLRHRRGNRIFQHLSIPDIIDVILGEWGQSGAWEVERSKYPKLEYKVQYGESDFDFVSRLLEEAGICFYFPDEGAPGSPLTFSDRLDGNPMRSAPPLAFVDDPTAAGVREFVIDVRTTREVRPGRHTIRDFDYRSPAFELVGASPKMPPEDHLEQYVYAPGSMSIEGGSGGATPVADDKSVMRSDQEYGKEKAERHLMGARMGREKVFFTTNTIDLWPGAVATIEDHPHADVGKPLLLLGFDTAGNVEGEEWTMRAEAVFAEVTFRPPVVTPKPSLQGVQSATVVGPSGQEIYTDEFGRVRVQFPWDREGKNNDDSSVWMRVSQGWAGTGFGFIQIPRIGQEVLVGFLEGDPDQPIVVGRVFNGVEQVPYKLPENKTVTGLKTNSTPGGGGYNEIKLEDKAGLELFYLQAQRNYDELIKNDETERTIGNHRKTVVGNQDLVIKTNKRELVESNDSLHVAADQMTQIDGRRSLIVGVEQHAKVGTLHAVDAGEEIHLKAGARVVIDAGSRLTIKGPGGFVDIHAGGVDIVGTVVNINSGGSAGAGAPASPVAPSDPQEAEPKDHS
ncbi:MAG: type VI secretion system tip protein TssI/VgrG [Myxococcota bacterium]